MNIQAEKIKLAQYILSISSEESIQKIKNYIINQKQEDFWNELPLEIQREVEEAIKELENGKGITHEKVMKKYEKWLKK